MKLSIAGDPEKLVSIWAGNGLLATSSGENMIRMFNLEADENYVLTTAEAAFGGRCNQDKITSISYNSKFRTLAAGTQNGNILLWKSKTMSLRSPTTSEEWEARPPFSGAAGSYIYGIEWGGSQTVLSAQNAEGIAILNQIQLQKKMKKEFKMMQTSSRSVEIRLHNEQNKDFVLILCVT